MSEVHAKPIVDGVLWLVEENGEKIATLQKHENKFLLCNNNAQLWLRKDELIDQFGDKFFLPPALRVVPKMDTFECYGFETPSHAYNAMYDVRRNLALYTDRPSSKCYYCAGWFAIKIKDWNVVNCPKLIIIERHTVIGPFKTAEEAKAVLCKQ